MAVTFYGDAAKAAELGGVEASAITDALKEAVNTVIDSEIRTEGFGKKEVTEYYDIRDNNKSELMLKKFPVIENSVEIIDDVDNVSTVLDSTSYRVDLETGIIQLKKINVNGTTSIGQFTKGNKTVQVKYEHGFASVPALIAELATLLMAKAAKVKDQNADADGLRSFTAGNYSESRDLAFMNVSSEFDKDIEKIMNKAKILYYLE